MGELLDFKKPNYMDFLCMVGDFISLDISITGTGWVKKSNNVITYGVNGLKSEEELDRRREFRKFLIELAGDSHYDFIVIEDVIGGNNFNTTKGLIQLNSIADDLIADGILNIDTIKREDNNTWKMYLKKIVNYEPVIKKEDPKTSIRNCMNILEFTTNVQDIYDAMGMVVAIIYRDIVLNNKRVSKKPLKYDLKTGYLIKQYTNLDLALKGSEKLKQTKYNREIEQYVWLESKRDVLYLFKQLIKEQQRDDKIYIIHLKSNKLGVLALTKKLDTTNDETYIVITKLKV